MRSGGLSAGLVRADSGRVTTTCSTSAIQSHRRLCARWCHPIRALALNHRAVLRVPGQPVFDLEQLQQFLHRRWVPRKECGRLDDGAPVRTHDVLHRCATLLVGEWLFLVPVQCGSPRRARFKRRSALHGRMGFAGKSSHRRLRNTSSVTLASTETTMSRGAGPSRFTQSQMATVVAMSALDVHQKIAEWCSVPIWMGVNAMTHAISAAEGTYRTNSVVTTPVQKALGPFLPNRTPAKTSVIPRTTSEVADPMEMQSPCPPDIV